MKRLFNRFFNAGGHRSRWTWFFLFACITGLVNLRQHLVTNYNCEFCADKAGYYMYLPAVFEKGFHADAYPANDDHLHGDGFHLDTLQNKVVTKFTCGVALLLSPFYACANVVAKLFLPGTSPYSSYYLFFISLGAAFYVVLGLFFLAKWLENYVNSVSAFLTVILIFTGTNLYYYTLDESLMSHLYSFSLFCMLLYALKAYTGNRRMKHFLFFSITLSLAVLIRPTNFLFGIFAFFSDIRNARSLKEKFSILFTVKNTITGIVVFLLVMLPQFLYWKFAFGKYIVWSYEGEGFTNWSHPAFLVTWFSPQSGLFPYTPILLVALAAVPFLVRKKFPNAWLVPVVFIVVSYMCASWHNPFFGVCNFGKRPMVEYMPLLMLPFAFLFSSYRSFSKPWRILIATATLFFVFYNQALFAAFNTCFDGGTWAWGKFFHFAGYALQVIH